MRQTFALIFLMVLMLIPCAALHGLPATVLEPGDQAEIASKLDLGHPDVKRTAVTMARDYPGEFSINQVNAIYRNLVEEKRWNYFNDPSSKEYYKYANETLEDGYRAGTGAVGDCDDFSILMASLIECLHGSARIKFAHDELTNEDHAYPELYVGKKGDPIVEVIKNYIKDDWGESYVQGLSLSEDDSLWINLDYNATYPGGFVFGGDKATTEVAWTSGNLTSPKVVPLIDSMDSLGSWKTIKDDIGSSVTAKNVASRKGMAIEISYDLGDDGFVGISRDVDPRIFSELEGINFTYLTASMPSILEMILIDDNHTEYNLSWIVSGRESVGRPEWVYLQGLFRDFHKVDLRTEDFLEDKLNRSNVICMKFIIHKSSDGSDISGNGSIAIDQIRGVLRIPEDSIWSQVRDERERALAAQLAIDSRQILDHSPSLIERSLLLAVESMRRHPTSNGYQALIDSLTLFYPQKDVILHDESVTKVEFSPDGKYLATASRDGTTKLLDLESMVNTSIAFFPSGEVDFIVFSPNSKYLAAAANFGDVKVFNTETHQVFGNISHWNGMNDLEFSSNSRYLATAGQDKHATLMNIENNQIIADVPFDYDVKDVEFSPNNRYLAMACSNGSAKVLDLETNQIVIGPLENESRNDSLSESSYCEVCISGDSNYMAISSDFGAKLLDLNNQKVTWIDADYINDIEFSPDSRYLAAATSNGLKLIELESKRDIETGLHFEFLDKIVFSPDSKYLGIVGGSAERGQRVRLLDLRTRQIIGSIHHKDSIFDIKFSQDSNYLATASRDRTAKILVVNTGEVLVPISHVQPVWEVEFSPNSRFLATASWDGTAKIMDLIKEDVAIAASHNSTSLEDVEFSPDNSYLASASMDGRVKLRDLKTSQFVITMPIDSYKEFLLTPDSNYAAIYDYLESKVDILDLRSRQFWTNMTPIYSLNDLESSSNGKYLAAACEYGSVKLLNLSNGQMATIRYNSSVNDLEFSPDNMYLVTASENGSIMLLNLGNQMSFSFQLSNDSAISVRFSNDSRYLAIASKKGDVNLLSLSNRQIVATIPHNSSVNRMVFSPDNRYFATASDDHTAKILNLSYPQAMFTMQHKDRVISVDFSPNSDYLAAESTDYTLDLLNIREWRLAAQIPYDFTVNGEKFSPDDRYLAIAGSDGSVNIFDLNTQEMIEAADYRYSVDDMNYSPDGRYLATAGDNIVYLINLSTFKVSTIAREEYVTNIAFSPDSNFLVIGCNHGNVEIISFGTLETLANLPHNSALRTLDISPNGKYMENLFENVLEIRLWQPKDLISEACSRLTRNLTAEEWQSYLPGENFRKTCLCDENQD